MDKDFIAAALEYHRSPTRGKIAVVPTKGLTNQRDLALAYESTLAFIEEEGMVVDLPGAVTVMVWGPLSAPSANLTANASMAVGISPSSRNMTCICTAARAIRSGSRIRSAAG